VASLEGIDLTVLDQLAAQAYKNAVEKGFYEEIKFHPSIESMRSYFAKRVLLLVSEAVEAFDEQRDGRTLDDKYYKPESPAKPEGFTVEIIDLIIRSLDLLGYVQEKYGVKPSEIFAEKFNYNLSRPAMHGKKF
jgi:hypothetical protein